MTESARVKEEIQLAEYKKWWEGSDKIIRGLQGKLNACQEAHTKDSHLLKASLKHAMELTVDRDAQAALAERMRDIANEALDKRLQFGYEHKRALHQIIDLETSSALQEFKERCWLESAKAAFIRVADGTPDEIDKLAASIVAELKKEGR